MAMDDTVIIESDAFQGVRGDLVEVVAVQVTSAEWSTPGSELCAAIRRRPEIVSMFERLEKDRYAVFVILESDPEDLLDLIYEAERGLYSRYSGLPFDVRVMRPSGDWSDENLRREARLLHDRKPRPRNS